MTNFKLRWGLIAQAMLFSAAAFLVRGTAHAQVTTPTPVNGFVVINPISVCVSGVCTPFGASCTTITSGTTAGNPSCTVSRTPSTATATTPIGFVDADTNVNLTRAFLAQAGIDVAFFPVQSYNSPANAIPSSWNNIKDIVKGTVFTYSSTNYQTLHLVNVQCQDGFPALTSPDFQALTQHPVCTEHGGLSGTYSKLANPPPAPSTVPPLAINGCSQARPCSIDPITKIGNSNAIDVFFVSGYQGTAISTPQYGFSWINGNGVSVGSGAFTGSRFDTLAHEIGHAVAFDHVSLGASDTVPYNMMSSGSSRYTSKSSGCWGTTLAASGNPPVYPNGALFDLDYRTSTFDPCKGSYDMLVDQLTPGTCAGPNLDPTTCKNQEGAASLSRFINKTLASNAIFGGGSCCFASPATTSTSSSSNTVQLQVSATSGTGNPDDAINSIIIGLSTSSPLSFNGNSPVTFVSCTDQTTNPPRSCDVTMTSQSRLNGNNGFGNSNCMKSIDLAPASEQCIQVFFSSGFTAGKLVTLTIAFNKNADTIVANNLLAGAQYTLITGEGGFATTSLFGNADLSGAFSANSQIPDLTTPNQIQNPQKFVNAAAADPTIGPYLARCTPPYTFVKVKGQLVPVCPDKSLSDGPD